jgi:hypothetical protein
MAPKPKTTSAADMLADATKTRDAVQARLDRENDKVSRAAERATAAEKVETDAVAARDAVQEELTEAQRLVDALAVLVDGAPNPQTVEPEGVPSGEQVMTDAVAEPVA